MADTPQLPGPWWSRSEILLALVTLLTTIFGAYNSNRAVLQSKDNAYKIEEVDKNVMNTTHMIITGARGEL